MNDKEKTLMLIGLYAVLNNEDKKKYRRLMKAVFPSEFEEVKE